MAKLESEQQEGPGRRERKKQEVQRRIRAAAAALFRGKGYDATTVEEIAERADVAKGTFFNYFARKDLLLEALAEEMLGELMTDLGEPQSWRGPIRTQLLRLFCRIGELAGRDAELSRVMIFETMRNLWLRQGDELVQREFRGLIGRLLAEGRERGEFPALDDLDATVKLLEAAHFTAMVEWLRAGTQPREYETRMTAMFEIIFRGLGAGSSAGGGEA